MDHVRFGVAGIGGMGISHAEQLFGGHVEGASLAAVSDVNPERLTIANERFPGVKTFDNADDMFDSKLIDAVVIATPHYYHPPVAVSAFEHGVHVLSEKPAGVHIKQVREMNEKAAASGVTFGIMFNLRRYPVYRKMRDMVINGELGEIRRTNWIATGWFRTQFYYNSGSWRATWAGEGGGVLLNQCPHNLDMWQWICGMPSKITAFCHNGKWHDIEVEDDVTAYVEYPNGATGCFIASTSDAPGTNRFEVVGENGKLVCEDGALTFYKLKIPATKLTYESDSSFVSPEYEKIEIETAEPGITHTEVLNAFAANILRGEPLVAEGYEGINSLMISNAMHLSSWLKKEIALPVDEELFLRELNKKRGVS